MRSQESALLSHPKALCNMIRRIAIDAGEITLKYFDDSGFEGASKKSDGSPVTIADQEAESYIQKELKNLTPDLPFVGEEAVARGEIPDLSNSDYFWLVDALDGTREFIKGSEEFTVNIALIHHEKPVLGVIYAPATGMLYAAHGDGTAIRWDDENEQDKPIHVRRPPAAGLCVATSRSHANTLDLDAFLARYKIRKTIKRGSSLKICAVAAGKADIYPRLGRTCYWDIAAGHAILNGAGGDILNMEGVPVTYPRHSKDFYNPEFIAVARDFELA